MVLSNIKTIKDINRVIDIDDIEKIKEIYSKTNDICKKDIVIKENFNDLMHIKILKSFSFWPYIYVWFIITYIFNNKIFEYIISLVTQYIKDIYF